MQLLRSGRLRYRNPGNLFLATCQRPIGLPNGHRRRFQAASSCGWLTTDGNTTEEKWRRFFEHHNKELNKLLARRQFPEPVPEAQWDDFKLGIFNRESPTLETQAEADAQYSLLVSFFMNEIDKFWKRHPVPKNSAWLGNKFERESVRRTIAIGLAYDFVKGFYHELGEQQRERERQLIDMRLPHAHALHKVREAVFGEPRYGGESKEPWKPRSVPEDRKKTLRMLAYASGDPHPFPDEEGEQPFFLTEELKKAKPDYRIRIVWPDGQPSGPINEKTLYRLRCEVTASRHYRRPFKCTWSFKGKGRSMDPPEMKKTNIRASIHKLGEKFKDGKYEVSVTVVDSSDPPQTLGTTTETVSLESKKELELEFQTGTHQVAGHVGEFAGLNIGYVRPRNMTSDRQVYHALNLDPELYRPVQFTNYKSNQPLQVYFLARADYDKKTYYCLMWNGRATFFLPVHRVGKIPVRLRVYLGGDRDAVFDKKVTIEGLPPRTLSQIKPARRKNFQDYLKRYQQDQAKQAEWLRLYRDRKDDDYWKRWLGVSMGRHQNHKNYLGVAYYYKNSDALLKELDQNMKFLQSIGVDVAQLAQYTANYRFDLLYYSGKYEEANSLMIKLEKMKSRDSRTYLSVSLYEKMMRLHRTCTFDGKKILEIDRRYRQHNPNDTSYAKNKSPGQQAEANRVIAARKIYPKAFENNGRSNR